MTTTIDTTPAHGSELLIPLHCLKKSPRNARKTPHRAEDIETLAASIQAKGILQPPVVEPEFDDAGQPTGNFLVTIGEGRRQAQLLRVKRKQIKKTEPVRCVIDTENDAHEISLDENVTRFAMHPADQFDAFHRLATEQGLGAEAIAARFGVTATVVRQRLRLAAVSPALLQAYRDEELTLDQLMAFAVTDDHARQGAVWESLPPYERHPTTIRRRLTQDRVAGSDRRVRFVGAEVYEAAGGVIERDLFADDDGGYFASPQLLDTLALESLQSIADTHTGDGWNWAAVSIERPHTHGLPRFYPKVRAFTSDEQADYDDLMARREVLEAGEWSDEQEEAITEVSDALDRLEAARLSFDAEDKARGGVFVYLTPEGQARSEYGFVRPEDLDPVEEDTAAEAEEDAPTPTSRASPKPPRLSDKLVRELTAERTAALRNELAEHPGVAFAALLHALVLRTFSMAYGERSCLDIRPGGAALHAYAPGIAEGRAGKAMQARHDLWAARIAASADVEAFIDTLTSEDAAALLAHCVSLTASDVHMSPIPWTGDRPADRLARKVDLDMTAYWTPTVDTYFGRVSKGLIVEAATEAGSPDAHRRLGNGKKADMAAVAEALVAGTGWLPEPLRTHPASTPEAIAAE